MAARVPGRGPWPAGPSGIGRRSVCIAPGANMRIPAGRSSAGNAARLSRPIRVVRQRRHMRRSQAPWVRRWSSRRPRRNSSRRGPASWRRHTSNRPRRPRSCASSRAPRPTSSPCSRRCCRSAARLCDAFDATIFQVDGDGLRLVAHEGPIPSDPVGAFPLVRGTTVGRAVLEGRTIHVLDVQAEIDEYPEASARARSFGFPVNAQRSSAPRGEGYRGDRHPADRGTAVHRPANRASGDIRRAGRYRDRERAPVQRDERDPRAADGDCARSCG